ncbi:MAG: aryl-sulfate sulfotransferase [Bacteroidota bacterium]|nr:aryl-sulfate sulfotransferase [Bacteroidota bacterium]MDP4233483.1 aryl-sulfate sulfotransferase [Bacteroidota bacterium]MDP4243361.1 aryl-sulfate sulfotransferase [Bacteroidota bacterium]MDP4287953.1 aryl-sulfate sulfotransferase [Bacteroidota bacterium]
MKNLCSLLVAVVGLGFSSLVLHAQPPFRVTVDQNPAPGKIYTSTLGKGTLGPLTSYLVMFDEHGNMLRNQPCFQQDWHILDFQLQPNGRLTYGAGPTLGAGGVTGGKYYVMDTATWSLIDSLQASPGYQTDIHELRMFPDGHYALIGVSDTLMARKDFRPGSTDTTRVHIEGNTVEVFDANKHSLFLWRGIDHYKVADADTTTKQVRLSDKVIDFQHANSIDFDASGNILISNRHLCELTLIKYPTGEILWRMGGKHNQFTLVGDSIWFSYQHAARFLPNGHITLFDNADIDSVEGKVGSFYANSRAVEYEVDPVARTVRLVWQYHHTPEIHSQAMGYVQRLPNQNTLVSWGFVQPDSVAFTEVRPDNSTAFEMLLSNGTFGYDYCYRAIKVPTIPASVEQMAEHSGITFSIEPQSSSSLMLQYAMQRGGLVTIAFYDLLARVQLTPKTNVAEPSGDHMVVTDISRLPGGAYYCELRVNGISVFRPFIRQ